MRALLRPTIVALLSVSTTWVVACSSSAPHRTHDPVGGTGGGGGGSVTDAGGGGAGGGGGATPDSASSSTTVCEPAGSGCQIKVVGGPPSGAECLAMRDNAKADHVQLRQVWTRITAPVGNTIDTVYGTLQLKAELPLLTECNMGSGTSGYIRLVDWDRSDPDPTKQTARVGWANYVDDARTAKKDGLCFVELTYDTKDSAGATAKWAVKPVVQKRVMQDFTAAAVRDTIPEGEGVFYYDEATGVSHHYSRTEYIAIFDDASKLAAVPAHDSEIHIRFNDAANLNCAGKYMGGALDPANDCFSSDQASPTWGCKGTDCAAGEGPVETSGYFLITDLEKVYSTVLQMTLCVSYPGQAASIKDGWASPSGWGYECSGSPKWDPATPATGLPMGDFCSTTHSDATATCHDAYKSHSFAAMAAFNVQAAACHSTATATTKTTM